jgi:hypothetical protein
VETLVPEMPGLMAAHLVGGITTLPDDAPFPTTKDVDIHLIFHPGSPALEHHPLLPNILERLFDGLIMEAGIREADEYASPECVLGNPEIAHHLTLDSILYDPEGCLAAIQPIVREQYARRTWLKARLAHERAGLDRAFGFREPASQFYGISGQLNMLGYSATFPSAALDVARLQAPRIGGQFLVRLGATLSGLGDHDLFEAMLELLGVGQIDCGQASDLLERGAALFDTAVAVRATPHFFQHKLHPHMRDYFVTSCREMIQQGHPREAAVWITPYICSCADVIQIDGSAEQRECARQEHAFLQQALGVADEAVLDRRFEQARRIYGDIFALADRIAAEHSQVID